MSDQFLTLVTGASEGIGKAISLSLLDAGHRLALVSRNQEKLNKVIVEGDDQAQNALAYPADLTDPDQVNELVEAVIQREGKIDVLINNLGHGIPRQLVDTSDQEWHNLVAVNLSSAFYMCRAVLPHMRQHRKGVIVNIASRAGRQGEGDFAAYSALKHGLVGMTRALADSEARYGVRVNALCPGPVATERMLAINPSADHAGWSTPQDVAQAVRFLLSPAAHTMNGQMLDLFEY